MSKGAGEIGNCPFCRPVQYHTVHHKSFTAKTLHSENLTATLRVDDTGIIDPVIGRTKLLCCRSAKMLNSISHTDITRNTIDLRAETDKLFQRLCGPLLCRSVDDNPMPPFKKDLCKAITQSTGLPLITTVCSIANDPGSSCKTLHSYLTAFHELFYL